MAQEVSVRALDLPLRYLQRRNISLAPIIAGLDLTEKQFFEARRRIDWATFVLVAKRIAIALGGPEKLTEIGPFMMASGVWMPFKFIIRQMGRQQTIYRWVERTGGKLLFNNFTTAIEEKDQHVRFSFKLNNDYEASEEFFLINKGVFETLPTLMGYPPARVAMERQGQRTTYDIELVPNRRITDFIVSFFRRIRLNRVTAAAEIERNMQALEEEHQELQGAHRELETEKKTVARQAKHIQTVEELGRTLAEEIEPTRVADMVQRMLRERVGFAFAAYYTTIPGSHSLELASNNFRDQAPLTSAEMLSPDIEEIKKRLRRSGLGSEFLTSPDEGLLGAIVGRMGTSTDLPLFKGLLPHLTIAAKHSRTFRTIQELNRDLEQKVRERTEELSVANADLAVALDKAKELDKLKSQFFDNISHELRTPLSLIVLSVEHILHQPGTSEETRRSLEPLQRATDRLMRLINRLLDLTKLEAGKTKLHYAPLRLKGFLEAMLAPFKALATSRGLALNVEGPDVGAVHADLEMLEGVFQNLVGNALKFTNKGSITLRLSEDDDRVTIAVTDTGIGIRAVDLPLIFDRFAQADSAGVRRFEGSGIGLALVKEGVELHGGSVKVVSQPGFGTTFTLFFPKGTAHIREELRADTTRPQELRLTDTRRALAHAGVTEGAPAPLPQVPISADDTRHLLLLVEDDLEARQFLAMILRQHYRVIEAVNGREGLARLRSDKPTVVVSDVMMPEMSGLQMVQAVRADVAIADTPILLLTARHDVEDTLDGLSVGANDYVAKPFSPRELLARIDVQVRLREASSRLAASERLAALGVLTSGFAHEVRNPLNGLLNALQPLMDSAVEGGPADTTLLRLAIDCGNRIQGLAESLLTITRPTNVQADELRVTEVLDQALSVLQWKIPKAITVQKEYAFQDLILGEPGPLGQVFLNLMDNALRAMPKGGALTLDTRRIDTEIRIGIADTGVGIASGDLARVFEPFFTTRPAGEGTGLGLAFCRQIIERHGGRISVDSAPGRGTRFEVTLPIGDELLNAAQRLSAAG